MNYEIVALWAMLIIQSIVFAGVLIMRENTRREILA
jgi:hypothetical protein